MKPQRLLLILLACFALGMGLNLSVPSSVNGQSDSNALARVDDALRDLSQQLGTTLTRANTVWSWTASTYGNTSLGCPAPGTTYAQVPTQGYNISIEVRGKNYNYRANPTGSIFFQCVDGVPAGTVGVVSTGGVLPESEWWAWVHDISSDRLYLLTIEGVQFSMPRPIPPDMTLNPNTIDSPVVSRDGRYMVLPYDLGGGESALGIYAVEIAEFVQIHPIGLGERIELGFRNGSFSSGSSLIFDETGEYVAVGFTNINFDVPEKTTWRVVVYELTTGDAVYQLENSTPEALEYLQTLDNYDPMSFPRVVYFGEDVVHIQMIPAFAEGMHEYPAFAWHPNQNFVEASPYISGDIDVLPLDETAVFPYLEESIGRVEPIGPAIPFNALGIGEVDAPSRVWADPSNVHYAPLWTDSGKQVLFYTTDRWNVLTLGQNVVPLNPDITAVANLPLGFLSLTQTQRIIYHDPFSPAFVQDIWELPSTSRARIIWTSFPEVDFGLESITLPPARPEADAPPSVVESSAPVMTPAVIVNECPGTLPIRMAIGLAARVTFTDGTSTRLRESPGGTIVLQMEEGTPFSVIGGPICSGGYNWWQVELASGRQGWVAEGIAPNLYFIEPLP